MKARVIVSEQGMPRRLPLTKESVLIKIIFAQHVENHDSMRVVLRIGGIQNPMQVVFNRSTRPVKAQKSF